MSHPKDLSFDLLLAEFFICGDMGKDWKYPRNRFDNNKMTTSYQSVWFRGWTVEFNFLFVDKKVFAKLHFWNYARCSGSPFTDTQ